MKAIIPVAGRGTRLRPHTHTMPKALLHVAGKTIIEHILDEIIPLEPEEIVFIVGHLGDKIQSFIEQNLDIPARFVRQEKAEGIAHAIYQTKEYIEGYDEPTLIVLGDTIFKSDLVAVADKGASSLGVRAVDDPSRFGVVVLDKGRITKMVEKPDEPISNLAIAGVYYITDPGLLLRSIEHLFENDIRTRGEFQLTDALQRMIDEGHAMTTFNIDDWFDCGNSEALLDSNRTLLRRMEGTPAQPGCIVVPPVWIHDSATIQNSIIGPNVSVAKNALVRDSIVAESIVSEYATVEQIILRESIVGYNAEVKGRATSVNIGDSSKLEMA
jgi:glucose-1-phosphate thymidylyltransferase